ncbi:uncharacterized protein LOC135267304 [Tribolium castaneum]
MGELPSCRVKQTFPFYCKGIDYAGPFHLKDRTTRNPKIVKAYVCLFVCMAVKAVHIEVVSDLTTEAFLACLKRFISRRGKPKDIFSDNGLNFVGAANELRELYVFLKSESTQNKILEFLTSEKISWHFIPPRAPHMGGLWEAEIKSMKFHLTRIVGNASLTFEELNTIVTQVEAILNSRPLVPLSSNPDDLSVLTPGHFIIGRAMVALPDYDYQEIPENKLSRFQRLQRIVQHFWSRWTREYICELQNRSKWRNNSLNALKKGSLVIVRDDQTPPQQWRLGRVLYLHPGHDGIVRVVTIKFATQIVKRPVAKLCVLPVGESV